MEFKSRLKFKGWTVAQCAQSIDMAGRPLGHRTLQRYINEGIPEPIAAWMREATPGYKESE